MLFICALSVPKAIWLVAGKYKSPLPLNPLALMTPLAVILPVIFKSSSNEIPPTSPPADWKLSAKIVPLALIFPLAVISPLMSICVASIWLEITILSTWLSLLSSVVIINLLLLALYFISALVLSDSANFNPCVPLVSKSIFISPWFTCSWEVGVSIPPTPTYVL